MYDTPAYSVLHWREQCVLDNARVLWQRVVDQTRRDVDEHAEQLKNLANLAALTAGFAMSSFLQFSFDNNASQPGVLIAFGVTASLVAALDFIAMCLCNLMLACILKVAEDNVNEEQEAHFVLQCREFALRYKPGDRPPAPRRTFRKYWDARCRAEWQWAFFFFWLSIPLFLINMGVSAWVKFSRRNTPALLMTVILGLALAYLAATHTRWVRHINSERSQKDVVIDVKPAGLPWDWHRLPHAYSLSITYSRPIEPAHNDVLPDAIGHDDETTEAVLARWRAEDMQQRTLDNARVLWKRFVDSIRNDVEECSEQLRSLSFLAGILDGFAMSSLLQLPVAASTSRVVINGYSVTLGITVALMTVAMAMSGMMTMSIVKSGAQLVAEKEEALFMAQCYEFAAGFRLGDRPPALRRNFRNHWEQRCEGEWRRAFYMFTVGLVVFQIHLCFAAWVKFPPPYQTTAVLMTIILGLGLVGLVIANLRWSRFSLGVSTKIGGGARHENSALWVTPLRPVGLPFDWHLPPYTVLLHSPVHQHNGKAPSQAPSPVKIPVSQRAAQLPVAAITMQYLAQSQQRHNSTASGAKAHSLTDSTRESAGSGRPHVTCAGANLEAPPPSIAAQHADAHGPSASQAHSRVAGMANGAAGDTTAANPPEGRRAAVDVAANMPSPPSDESQWEDLGAAEQSHASLSHPRQPDVLHGRANAPQWEILRAARAAERADGSPSHQTQPQGHARMPQAASVRSGSRAGSRAGSDLDCESPGGSRRGSMRQLPGAGSGEDPGLADVWPYSGQMREEIVEQQHLNNARVLWERFASKNLTDLEERQEQLRIVVELSAVIAGFEMIAFLQFGFDTHATNYGLQLSYAVTSALTVALSSCSMTMCGLIMESILETGSAYLSPSAEADYMMRCREWVAGYQLGDRPPEPKRNFRNHWDRQCEDEWRRAFYMFSLSVPLYLINSAISAWIKWQTLRAPPAISSSVLGLAVLYLLLGHARWVRHLLGFEHVQVSKELSLPAGLPFDWHANPKPVPSSQRRRGSLNTPANGSSRSMATASSLSGV